MLFTILIIFFLQQCVQEDVRVSSNDSKDAGFSVKRSAITFMSSDENNHILNGFIYFLNDRIFNALGISLAC